MTTTQVAGAVISEKRGNSSTEYGIRGELPAVLDAIESLFDRYAADAYGTHCHQVSFFDGEFVARVSRSNSCE